MILYSLILFEKLDKGLVDLNCQNSLVSRNIKQTKDTRVIIDGRL